jgi:branched-chain amino acid transport system permease protein
MQALFGQLLIGLINGAFYAMLSLGLAVIFGLLNIINFTHGAQYMMGAFLAWFLLTKAGIGYWWSLLLAPIVIGAFGMLIERTMLARLYKLDHLYGLLLTFGLALIIQGVFRNEFGSSGLPYQIPSALTGGVNLGFMFLPIYRGWVIVASLIVCISTWYVIERTKLGSYLRGDDMVFDIDHRCTVDREINADGVDLPVADADIEYAIPATGGVDNAAAFKNEVGELASHRLCCSMLPV